MRPTDPASRAHGFTLAELLTVTAIIVILSAIALPVARFAARHEKEVELRDRLAQITWAIDQYAELRGKNLIKDLPTLGQTPYPKDLETLTKPIELIDGKRIHLLTERDLIDPITGRPEWRTVSTTDDPDTSITNGDDVWDIHSTSTALALDGVTHYDEW